jgi:hypothetical protein
MLWLPGLRLDLVIKTTPEGLSGACPITVEPSQNVTIPLGIPPPAGREDTVAVKDTDCPKVEGLAEETSDSAEPLGWIFCTIVTDDAEWLASPL